MIDLHVAEHPACPVPELDGLQPAAWQAERLATASLPDASDNVKWNIRFHIRLTLTLSDHSHVVHYAARPSISGRAVEFHLHESLTQKLVNIGYPAFVMLPVTRDGSIHNNSLT